MKYLIFTLFLLLTVEAFPNSLYEINDSTLQKEIQEITVLGKLSKSLSLPLVSVNSERLQSSSFFTPADALQHETGISLSRDGIWATSVNVRGLSEQRLLFLVDGDRIQTATDISAALSTVDMTSLNKIEVIKGASSVLYGSGAMGGIVNFVSERPAYSSTFRSTGKIGTEFNTANSLWANSANVQFTTKQWYLALTGSYRTAQNIETPQGKLLNSQFNDASWGLKGGILYTPNQELLVNYQHVGGWNIGLPGGSAFPATASVRYKTVDRNQLSAEYIISKVSWNLREIRLKAYSQNFSRDVENTLNPTTVVLPSSLNKTYGAKVTTDWRFTDYHTVILGAEAWERNSETSRLKIITPSDTAYSVLGEQPTPNAKMLDVGAFAHYSWKIVPRKLILNAGLRLDYIQTANDSAFNPLFKYTVIKGVKKLDTALVPTLLFESNVNEEISYAAHLDLLYYLTQHQVLAFSMSNSYRAASIEERFKYIDLGTSLHVGNPTLKPEHGTFANLSYKFSNQKIHLKFDVFGNYLFDLITEKSGNFLNRPAFIYTNVDKALFLGAELELNYLVTKGLSLYSNVSYTQAKDVVTKTYIPQIPPMSGLMSVNYQFANKMKAILSAKWAARQAEVAPTETSTNGHVIFNFNAQSAKIELIKSYFQLFAGIDNMLNTAYYNHLTTVRMGGKMYQEPGRNVYLKVKWGW
jgi:hemoglobin/transferrin/lactoferrin receptor protein